MPIFDVLFRTLLYYILITIAYRIMGKREFGQLSIMDFIVSLLITELAAISIDKHDSNLLIAIIPIFVLVFVQIIVAKLSFDNGKIRDSIEGKPTVVINRGKINFEGMLKQRYNIDDLLTQLRDKGVKSIEEVSFAVLETNGSLSVFETKNDDKHYPLPVILDGIVDEDVLIQIGKTRDWLDKKISEKKLIIEDVYYAFYRNNNLFIINKETLNRQNS